MRGDMESRDQSSVRDDSERSDSVARFLAVVADVFGVSELTPTDHFFDLGGDSLDAVIVMDRIESEFGVSPTLDQFFQSDSVSDLAERWWVLVSDARLAGRVPSPGRVGG